MERAVEGVKALPGCQSVDTLTNASVRGSHLTGYVASFDASANVSTRIMGENVIGGTSIYPINNVDMDEAYVLNALPRLGDSVIDKSPQTFSITNSDSRVWYAAMLGYDSYVKICRHIDITEHTTSWYMVVRSQLPISAREIENVFGSMTYVEMLSSPHWVTYINASSRNRNRIAAKVALGLGLRVDMHADATHTLESDAVNVAVPITEVITNTFYATDADTVSFYVGCVNVGEIRNGILISPTANSELWLHGDPNTGIDMRGGPFFNDFKNAFPISTGISDPGAMPDARERASIARRITWSNSMALNSSAVRGRYKPIDTAWFSSAVSSFGWNHPWGYTALETIISKVAADDEHVMDLDMLLKLNESKSHENVVLSMRNTAVHQIIDHLDAVRYAMEGNGCLHVPTLSDIMSDAETGTANVPYQMLLALRDVLDR